jgi:hypothetical protein
VFSDKFGNVPALLCLYFEKRDTGHQNSEKILAGSAITSVHQTSLDIKAPKFPEFSTERFRSPEKNPIPVLCENASGENATHNPIQKESGGKNKDFA